MFEISKIDLMSKACDRSLPLDKREKIIDFISKTKNNNISNNYVSMVRITDEQAREFGVFEKNKF